MNAATLKQEDALTFRKVTPARLPANRSVVEPTPEQPKIEIENSPEDGAPKKNNRLRNLVAGVATLAVGVATGIYYFEFVAPYESTDDAFIEAHVTPIAPQVAGRVAQLLVQDNQEVKAGDVLLQIDPSDFQT